MTEDSAPYFVDLDDHAELITEYNRAKADAKRAEEEVQHLREQLVKLLPDAMEAPDGVIAMVGSKARLSYQPYARRQLNQQRLRTAYPAVWSACTDYAAQWTLRVIGDA